MTGFETIPGTEAKFMIVVASSADFRDSNLQLAPYTKMETLSEKSLASDSTRWAGLYTDKHTTQCWRYQQSEVVDHSV